MEDIKQVIVVRTKYPDKNGNLIGIRAGKLIAQACHVSQEWIRELILKAKPIFVNGQISCFNHNWIDLGITDEQFWWLKNNIKKVTVQVSSEEELISLRDKALSLGLTAYIITDLGLTEFNGIPTKTALAIGPNKSELIDQVTKELKLY